MADTNDNLSAANEKKWYVVQTYSTFEKRVQQSIKDKAEREGLSDRSSSVLFFAF